MAIQKLPTVSGKQVARNFMVTIGDTTHTITGTKDVLAPAKEALKNHLAKPTKKTLDILSKLMTPQTTKETKEKEVKVTKAKAEIKKVKKEIKETPKEKTPVKAKVEQSAITKLKKDIEDGNLSTAQIEELQKAIQKTQNANKPAVASTHRRSGEY